MTQSGKREKSREANVVMDKFNQPLTGWVNEHSGYDKEGGNSGCNPECFSEFNARCKY